MGLVEVSGAVQPLAATGSLGAAEPAEPTQPAEAAITVQGLTYSYPGATSPAVTGLDFQIRRGEIFGFLGPSGAGKSTTQRILIRLLDGYRGDVQVLGRALSEWGQDYYEHVGVAFEFPNHFLKLTA